MKSKPRTEQAMKNLIKEVRLNFPFEMTEEELCADSCSHGCPKKLLEYIEVECEDWQQRLDNGETPTLKDIQQISKSSYKIYAVLQKNKLVE